MSNRQVLLYFAWSRPAETGAPLAVIDDRFPAVFELRRLFYPKFEISRAAIDVDPGIGGFLDHIQKPNFAAFAERAEALTGNPTIQAERVGDDGATLLDAALIADADTIVVISFDSFRTDQAAAATEIEAVRRFLENPDHLIFVCPHHDIGEATDAAASAISMRIVAEGRAPWPDRFALPSVERILCGHIHRFMQIRFGGTMLVTAPSTTTAIALCLQPDAEAASFVEPPAMLLHHWRPRIGLVTHFVPIGSFPGPFPFC